MHPDKRTEDPKSIAKGFLKSMSELQYIDRPMNQNAGVCHLDDQRQPTHDSDAVGNTMFWCKRWGAISWTQRHGQLFPF